MKQIYKYNFNFVVTLFFFRGKWLWPNNVHKIIIKKKKTYYNINTN